jgi:long-chain fatty acid transport protein
MNPKHHTINRRRHASGIALAGLAALAALAAMPASATDGYFDYGYGVKAKGIGGAGVAFPQDSIAPATNPAGAAFLDNRLDFGLTYFNPERYATLGGAQYSGNKTENFIIPEIGVIRSLTPDLTFALSVFGNGGMNTDYTTAVPILGSTPAGVDLEQIFVAPTLTYKLDQNNAIGISPIFAYQRFKAHGLQNFGISDKGYDESYGGGVRVGYTGNITDWLSVGATYQSRIYNSRFRDYSNLFAEHGDFDIPSNFALGFALKPTRQLTFAFDVERIFYSEVKAVGNDVSAQTLASGLGSDGGPGFGWRDVTAIKTGIAYDLTDTLTLRVGYNHSTQPVANNQTYFNVLAPAVVQHHATAGLTWKVSKDTELSAFYAHAFESQVHGSNNFFGANPDIRMKQDSFGLSAEWKY